MCNGRDKRILERTKEHLENERNFAKIKFVVGMGPEVKTYDHKRDGDESKFFPRRLTHKFTNVRERRMEVVVAPMQNNIEKKAPSDSSHKKKRSRSRNEKHTFEKWLLVQYVKQSDCPNRQQR